jgi:protein SCO1/2
MNFLKSFTFINALAITGFCSLALATGTGYSQKEPTEEKQSHELPKELVDVGLSQKLGQKLPLDLEFINDKGETVKLGDYFSKGRPVLLSMVYYKCPSLCNFHLNGLTDVMKNSKAVLGKDYEFVAVSMNHRETADLAAKKKETYVKALGNVAAEKHWHFLVGNENNVKILADALGFQFKWIEATQQYSHPAIAYINTPTGELSRYLHGIEFSPETFRLSLVESSKGQIGTIIDQLVLFCFQFDPTKNKYTLYAFNLMRLGALITLLLLAVLIVPIWRKEKQRAV